MKDANIGYAICVQKWEKSSTNRKKASHAAEPCHL